MVLGALTELPSKYFKLTDCDNSFNDLGFRISKARQGQHYIVCAKCEKPG